MAPHGLRNQFDSATGLPKTVAPLSVETSRETRANRRPLGVEDGEVDRVALLRFRVGGRAPVLAGEKGRADLDLTVGRAHVEQTRGADRTARLAPHLREHDRLAPGHQPLRLANQLERLVDRAGPGPGQVAADLLVLHRLEGARRATRGPRLERHAAGPAEAPRPVAQTPRGNTLPTGHALLPPRNK